MLMLLRFFTKSSIKKRRNLETYVIRKQKMNLLDVPFSQSFITGLTLGTIQNILLSRTTGSSLLAQGSQSENKDL